jgi:5-carboxymethyl-2-hydroxymuconate isomerase
MERKKSEQEWQSTIGSRKEPSKIHMYSEIHKGRDREVAERIFEEIMAKIVLN